MLGSSADTTTNPPLMRVIAEFINGSAATFKPTCFIETIARFPANETPRDCSYATFSLTHQLARMGSPSLAFLMRYSIISEAGVPGYEYPAVRPAWMAPNATASSPSKTSPFIPFSFVLDLNPPLPQSNNETHLNDSFLFSSISSCLFLHSR